MNDLLRQKKINGKIGLNVLVLCLFLPFCITACGGGRPGIKSSGHPSSKLVVLSEKSKGASFKPYVINGERYYPLSDADGFVQSGKASWYGKKFHGRPTASGEIFDMHKKSAAHKTLPLGTYVRTLNLSNNKQIIVRVNDRGPFVKGRIIDLSYAAAKEIGLINTGVADVKIVALGREVGEFKSPQGTKTVVEIKDLKTGDFTIQVGAFKDKNNALTLSDRLKVIFDYVDVAVWKNGYKGTMYRVRVSKSKTLIEANKIEKKLEDMGFEGAFIVRL
ncbi:MAG: septal ring lytic transglycosylase RlpA family protein [Desulfobacterales bacterium]|nr:septal ring lytic transglycosylase RlpA family protein [Desulfobacterales bacterium]